MKGERKLFSWYLHGQLSEWVGTNVAQSYVAEADYKPLAVILTSKKAPTGSSLSIGIRADGVNLFDQAPNLSPGLRKFVGHTFMSTRTVRIAKGSLLTLDLLTVGSGESGSNLTVQLELEEL